MYANRPVWMALLCAAALVGCAAQTSPTDADDDPYESYQVAVWCGEVCTEEGRCVDTGVCECFYDPQMDYTDCQGEGQLGMSAGNNAWHMEWVCCQAVTSADCAGSVACVEQDKCIACDGFCQEGSCR